VKLVYEQNGAERSNTRDGYVTGPLDPAVIA